MTSLMRGFDVNDIAEAANESDEESQNGAVWLFMLHLMLTRYMCFVTGI